MQFTQRLKFAAFLAVAALQLHTRAEVDIPDEYKIGGFAMGCQAYTFNRYTAFEAIEKTAAAGGRVIEFYPGQTLSKEEPALKLDHNATDETIEKIKAKLKKHNLLAVNYGVVGLPNKEEECRKVFAFAKKLGMRGVTSEPSPDAMDLIEKLCVEYDLTMGIHNHPKQPKNPNYKIWDPTYVLSLVKNRDRRVGACADIGHFVRSGIKGVDALKILEGRIHGSHMKDLSRFGEPHGHDVPFGTGVSEIAAVFAELKRQNFAGHVSIEYEHNLENNVIDAAQCIGYVRGITAAK